MPDSVRSTVVFIYGPPAVGKLTVAQRVADRSGFKLFHNHLVIDAVASLFSFGEDAYHELVKRFRRDLIEAAARDGLDFVITYGYVPEEEWVIRDFVDIVARHQGRMLFVQLVAPRAVLAERVALPSRREHGKLVDPGVLAEMLERWDFYQPVPWEPNLTVDTSKLDPDAAADRVVSDFQLRADGHERAP